MSLFTDTDEVKGLLGPNLSSSDLSDAEIAAFNADESGKIVDELAGWFVPFNDRTDTPATPQIIQQVALRRTLARCMEELHASAGFGNYLSQAQAHRDRAERVLDQIKADPYKTIGPVTKSGETLTFGTADAYGWTIAEDKAFLADTSPISSGDPPYILEESVWITGGTDADGVNLTNMRLGKEYVILYDESRPFKPWIFKAQEARLYNGTVTGLQVRYQWTYQRHPSLLGGISTVTRSST